MSTADEKAAIGSDMGNENSTPAEGGAPNPPPKELPEWRARSSSQLAPVTQQKSATPAPGPPRLKKKVPWKGKNIMVLLPWDNERGQHGKTPLPLTAKEVDSMLGSWEDLGYRTRGFDLGHDNDTIEKFQGALGQSRSIWPDASEVTREREQRQFRVNIPDRREWDAYVQELSEAKLRALGVSFGDEIPVLPSPVPSAISRRTSMQYPALPFSPPIPTNSAASMSHHANTFSPALMSGPGMSASQSSNTASIASPASMHAQMQGKYNPRQSVSFNGGEHPFGSPFQYPQQPSPGVWSPQQLLYQQGGPRGGSPSLQNLGAIVSPGSPFLSDGYFQNGDVASQMQQRQQLLQTQLHQQQQLQLGARASPRLQEVSEIDEEMSKSPSKTPEARQIKHNPSASLQKEIDDAEYHLEEQFQRQLEHEDYSPHSDKAEDGNTFDNRPLHARNISSLGGLGSSRFARADPPKDGPTLHHPQPHSRGHSLSQRPFQETEDVSSAITKSGLLKKDLSDIETIPSHTGTPLGHDRSLSTSSNPWADSEANNTDNSSKVRRPGHASRSSMSTLNVAAKEFKFDPAKAFSPNSFTFNSGAFQPSTIASSAIGSGPISSTSSHFSRPSFGSGKINVAAPVFTPGQSEFSFSASGPTFRPDAPAFTPTFNSNFAESVGSINSGGEGPKPVSSIFGPIDLSALGISKPSKKNAAIPIIRPDSGNSRDDEAETFDKDGRLVQGEGRNKRARGGKAGGDSEPLFASNMPLGETSREQSPPKDSSAVATSVADKENSDAHVKSHPDGITEDGDRDIASWEFKQQKQAEESHAARPFTSRRYQSGLPGYGFYGPSEDDKSPIVNEMKPEPVKKHKKNSLSGAAKPFIFRPGSFTFAEPAPEPETDLDGEFLKDLEVEHPALTEHKPEPVVIDEFDVASGKPDIPEAITAVEPTAPAQPISPVETTIPVLTPQALPKLGGLSNSRWARSPTPPPRKSPDMEIQPNELSAFQASLPGPESPPTYTNEDPEDTPDREPTFEEIDAVMRHLNEVEIDSGPTPFKNPHRDADIPRWTQPSPTRRMHDVGLDNTSPLRLQPQNLMRSDAPSPSPARFRPLPGETRIFSRVQEDQDPFVADSPEILRAESPHHRLGMGNSIVASDWDDVLSDGEAAKLQPRARFFDSRVNDLVGGLLAQRLDPLEKALEQIQMSIETMGARAPSSRRNRRSFSGALSDADDEDDDLDGPRRSLSPRKDKKMDRIKTIINEALAAHQLRPQSSSSASAVMPLDDARNVMAALEDMKEQFGQSMRLDLRGEDLRNIVAEAVQAKLPSVSDETVLLKSDLRSIIEDVQSRVPSVPALNESALKSDLQAIIQDVVQKRAPITPQFDEVALKTDLRSMIEDVVANRRPTAPEINEAALSKEAEAQSRIRDLEDRLRRTEAITEQEIHNRRAVEDRLAENQRLLRISTEEEMRLRESMDERETKIRQIVDASDAQVRQAEDNHAKSTMRIAFMEASQENLEKTQIDLNNRLAITEAELRNSQQEVQKWQMDAERALETARRHSEDAEQANDTNKDLRRTIESLRAQMEESVRVREGMRVMLTGLQEDMAIAARDIAHENAQRAKREAELVARHEVLEAKLEFEATTRERLEREVERLESENREGSRAISDSKRLEGIVLELRQESHLAQKEAMKYQREFEEARESGLAEVQRTRNYMQAEIDTSNYQVNAVRDDLEAQIARLRNELDQVKLDSDTTREKHEMLLESSEVSKSTIGDELRRKHASELEDIQAQHDRQLGNALEDAQRQEQHLLDRLSLSSSKTEHLQDRVSHLEEKLEIAKSAANAAVAAAKGARSSSIASTQAAPFEVQQHIAKSSALPERISPQALRESIMVLQEQLQEREQSIEKLEAKVAELDPEAAVKIQKRDDEIMWLRELLEVRKSDLTDVVTALESGKYNPDGVKDAAIRLRANIQMEEQERERALNGGSSLTLPNIAASLRDAASPRVVQAVGPLAAAWGNWRKGRSESTLSEAAGSTPARAKSPSGSFLNGLLTPPASQIRTPPTATASSNQRFTPAQLANRPRNMTPRAREKQPMRGSPRKPIEAPSTPPMMRQSSYDADANVEDFSDAGFYDDDESAIDDNIYGGKLR